MSSGAWLLVFARIDFLPADDTDTLGIIEG